MAVVDLIVRNGDARSRRAGRPSSSELAMVDQRRRASSETAMLQLDVRGPGGIVECGDARAKKSRLGVRGGGQYTTMFSG
uniref:hypothetical protein n=1 Tax=Bordetella pertussis TaxID=520 RepID=UPI001595BA66|nr:hypothetical protein [Bordetella pertussis]